ncbi:beta-ketoacyl synthase N-terminal-like domain-containing protein [Streptomyces sp. DSM 44917]|uniref:Beta-ketoacyl synthase N-terminal-like domain-containing protein n=1 Tax=Streptomyces boetiae TaxID=3075541 RepID=A0ABU2L8S8_9ACTN|nr:polyketide synthase [Streptomyces sp. DSM 44917]MDT0307964.1 beta-ketoacyl synthase N-terminal-like domain-containing protein [Streptomyces sp. DSM 44917]
MSGGPAAAGDNGAAGGVAIVGMAAMLPGAGDLDAYWRNLVEGVDAISEVPQGRWDPSYYPEPVYCRRGGFVDEFAEVEVTRFGIMPNSVPGTEPDQLIALAVAADALADAGGEERLPDRDRIGVVLGRGGYLSPGLARLDQRLRTAHQLTRTLGELLPELGADQLARVREAFTERLGPDAPEHAIGLVPNLAASRVANRLDLRGPAYTVDAACASSLIAVDQAVAQLASGACDLMLAGGVHHCHDITLWSVFAQLKALSPSQRSRPFHAGADGILIGEGTGVVVLKRLADAQRDGDRIYAVIRGTGVAGDGRAGGLVNPDPGGQTRAVRQAWRAAGLDPRDPGALGLLEAHGTGTPAGDAAELATLAEVFGPQAAGGGPAPAIGSVKSMIGHTMPAAGAAGLIKAALAVHRATLLPTLHVDEPHPALAATRFRPLSGAEPWEAEVRRAAVNAFGFGGINAHVVLEQAPGTRPAAGRASRSPSPASVREPERVLRLSAATPAALSALLEAEDAAVRALPANAPGEAEGPARLGIVDPTGKRLALARRVVARGRAWRGRDDVWFSDRQLVGGADPGRLAFLFPGLEAEFEPRGLDEVAERFGLPMPARAEAGAGDAARQGLGVLSIGRLLDRALRRMGVAPDAVAGHSVGEWSAMTAGGLHSEEQSDELLATYDPDSLRIPGLAFGALGTSAERVAQVLAERPDDGVVLSHDNSPRQSMVCGPEEAVTELVRWFRSQRVLGRVLPFRSGFHTPMLKPYVAPLAEGAERFEVHPALVPVWSATIAAPFPSEPAAVRELFLRHLLEPVRFRPLIENMYAAGFRAFVQVGTGQLGSLVDDTLQGRDHLTVSANSPHRGGLAQLRRVALALWTEGAPAAFDALGGAPRRAAQGARAGQGAARPPARLPLGGALVSLDEGTRGELGAALRAAVSPATGPAVAPTAEFGALHGLAGRYPVAAELNALLAETASAAASVIAAALPAAPGQAPAPPSAPGTPAPHGGPPAAPGTAPAAARPGVPAPPAQTPPGPAAHPAQPTGNGAGPAANGRAAGATHADRMVVSTRTMPYLLDHCFFPQRPGWPDDGDRRPVIPATTIMRHLIDAAERFSPGQRVAALHDVRLEQWADAIPEVAVEITGAPAEDGRLAVAFGGYARARAELAARHPEPPAPWPAPEPASERTPAHTAEQLYTDRWMFHGPAFRGITDLTAVGERHIRGTITVPPAPGSLLDNVGQLLGYWVMSTQEVRTIVFPVQLAELRAYGPEPAPGTEVACTVRITSLSDTVVTADAQLTVNGRVWADLSGWQDRRFNGLDARKPRGYPERLALGRPRAGGWCLVRDEWTDLASRDLVMRTQLGTAERAAYAERPPRGRREWLLGRIAAKDAVRHWLWRRGEGEIFPAELEIGNDAAGRPFVTGRHGRELPPLALSLAHRGDVAVALVRPAPPGAPGVGIDVEEVTGDSGRAEAAALGERERALLESVAAGGERAAWFTRFWAAKEAAAKAEGTGLRGRPRDFAVVEASEEELTVATAAGRHRVRCAPVTHGARRYVVAWTAPEDPSEDPFDPFGEANDVADYDEEISE